MPRDVQVLRLSGHDRKRMLRFSRAFQQRGNTSGATFRFFTASAEEIVMEEPLEHIRVDVASDSRNVVLPSATTSYYQNRVIIVKLSGVTTGVIHVLPQAGQTVEGGSGIDLSGSDVTLALFTDGAEWRVAWQTNHEDPTWPSGLYIKDNSATMAPPRQTLLTTTGGSDQTVLIFDPYYHDGAIIRIKKTDSAAGEIDVSATNCSIDGEADIFITQQHEVLTLIKADGQLHILSHYGAPAAAVNRDYQVGTRSLRTDATRQFQAGGVLYT